MANLEPPSGMKPPQTHSPSTSPTRPTDSKLQKKLSIDTLSKHAFMGNCEISLNSGGRLDYVLQERPIEKMSQYVFAIKAHHSYWQNEDCCLFLQNILNYTSD